MEADLHRHCSSWKRDAGVWTPCLGRRERLLHTNNTDQQLDSLSYFCLDSKKMTDFELKFKPSPAFFFSF